MRLYYPSSFHCQNSKFQSELPSNLSFCEFKCKNIQIAHFTLKYLNKTTTELRSLIQI